MGSLYDPQAETHRNDHDLPHWMQDGVITFITLRLADSLPREVLDRWNCERLEFLRRHGVDCSDWKVGRLALAVQQQQLFDKTFNRKREIELDRCHGSCRLRITQAARIVHDSLLHFDDERYLMGDFVVMPNHVHLLVVFYDSIDLRKQCYSWMHFTATNINQLSGDSGAFWQPEPFDHLVRSPQQLAYLRGYIARNPLQAKLPEGEYLYRRSQRLF